jgi:hypothetical protein
LLIDDDVLVIDVVVISMGAGLVVYSIGAFLAIIGDRPAVVRHPHTKRWTAARSLRVELPRTQRFTKVPRSPLPEES